MLEVLRIAVEPLGSNCYLAWTEPGREAVVIDPGGEAGRIIASIEKRGLDVRWLLNTHGHGDHIAANRELKEKYGAPLLIHEADEHMLADPQSNMSAVYGVPVTSPSADGNLVPGEKVDFGGASLRVIHTPGHSPGGVSLHGEGVVFTGDALFMGSIGRCDLPGGDERTLLRAIRERLLVLPDETRVYPGHGPDTTIGLEKRSNPFLV